MKCPDCKKEMVKLDNTTFLYDSVMTQLFRFEHNLNGCFECNIVKKEV